MLDILDRINSYAPLLTLLVLTWTLVWIRRYTHAAEKQVKATQDQVEALHKPLLTIVWETMGRVGYEILKAEPGKPICLGIVPDDGLRIQNIGFGPAINVVYSIKDRDTGKEIAALSGSIPRLDVNSESFQTHIVWNHLADHARLEFAIAYESLGDIKYETKVSIDRREKANYDREFAVTQVKTVRQSN